MTQTLQIRSVQPDDYPHWRPLWDGYNAFYGRAGDAALPEAITRATWARFLDPAEPVHARVAVHDGQLKGIVHYLYHRSTTRIGPVCYLQDLFTAPQARGLGLGRALIRAVYGEARAAGASRVYWHTQYTNATARALYDQEAQHLGFMVYSHEITPV